MAKQNTPNTKPKADIDFEKELWDVANELRGAVAENQYKDYVLSLLFLKHLSERYEIRKQELQLSFSPPASSPRDERRRSTRRRYFADGAGTDVPTA